MSDIKIDPQREYLKYQLRCAGWTLTALGEELQVRKGSISRVISGDMRSNRIAEFIARELDTTPEALWPQVYGLEDKMS